MTKFKRGQMVGFKFRGKVYVGQYRGRDKTELNKRQHIIAFPHPNCAPLHWCKLGLSEFMVAEKELIPLMILGLRELPTLPILQDASHEPKIPRKPAKGRN